MFKLAIFLFFLIVTALVYLFRFRAKKRADALLNSGNDEAALSTYIELLRTRAGWSADIDGDGRPLDFAKYLTGEGLTLVEKIRGILLTQGKQFDLDSYRQIAESARSFSIKPGVMNYAKQTVSASKSEFSEIYRQFIAFVEKIPSS